MKVKSLEKAIKACIAGSILSLTTFGIGLAIKSEKLRMYGALANAACLIQIPWPYIKRNELLWAEYDKRIRENYQ